MIVILGPTAVGKTAVATQLAAQIDAEIISADSRQVFRGMDIGTGKDLSDYMVDGKPIPYHLIDIAAPGEEYNVYRFQQDFINAYHDISSRKKPVVLCGGTGFYIESVLAGYTLVEVPENPPLREEMARLSREELVARLAKLRPLHNSTDTEDLSRLYRAIEIEEFKKRDQSPPAEFPKIDAQLFGVQCERAIVRARITTRLDQRLEEGMIEEVQQLLDAGVPKERLLLYGLEYKFITNYLSGELSYDAMRNLLNTAIHQFAKRQMTWFRRMEKRGFAINWIPEELNVAQKVEYVLGARD